MRGHIRPRGKDTWQLVVDAGADPLTGKRRQVYRTVNGKKKKADEELVRLLGEVGRGAAIGSDATVRQLFDAWLSLSATRLEPRSVEFYERNAGLLPDWFAAMSVWKVRPGDVDRVMGDLLRTGHTPATCNTVHRTIRAGFTQAVRWEWIARNPATAARPPRHQAAEVHPPSQADLLRAYRAVPRQLRPWLLLAAVTGARVAEVAALRWGDLDLDAGLLRIRDQSVAVKGGGTATKPRTKTGRARVIALDESTLRRLRGYRRARERITDCAPDCFVLVTDPRFPRRAPRPDYASRTWAKVRGQLGMDGVRWHDWRHFLGTELIAAGVDPRTVAGRLGHAKTSTTLDIYAAFVGEADRRAATVAGGLLGGGGR